MGKKWWILIGIVLIVAGFFLIKSFSFEEISEERRVCEVEADSISWEYDSERENYIYDCILGKVVESGNVLACEEFGGLQGAKCIGSAAKNVSYCKEKYPGDNDNDTILRDWCIFGIASGTGETSSCFSVETRKHVRTCIMHYAVPASLNMETCNDLERMDGWDLISREGKEHEIEICVMTVAKATSDAGICNELDKLNIYESLSEKVKESYARSCLYGANEA